MSVGESGHTSDSLKKPRWESILANLKKLPMLVVFVALSFGCFLVALFPVIVTWTWPLLLFLMLLLGGLLAAILTCFRGNRAKAKPKSFDYLLVCIGMIVLVVAGVVRSYVDIKTVSRDRLSGLASDGWSPIVIEGVIDAIPKWRPDTLKLRSAPNDKELQSDNHWQTVLELQVTGVKNAEQWMYDRFGRIRIVAHGRSREWIPGDHVRCMIQWQRILPPTNPGQPDFSARSKRDAIFVRGKSDSPQQIQSIPGDQWFRLDRSIGSIVIAADQAFHRYVPLGQARMASALVLGQREQAEWELQESMLATGTIHMLAISGMHIELVAISMMCFCALVQMPRKVSLGLTIGLVVVYSLVAGANPPVMRATVFVITICLARWIGRPIESLNILAFAAVVLLLYKPSNLLDIGTQLSFLAVVVLILVGGSSPNRLPERDSLNDLLIQTSHPIVRWFWYIVDWSSELLKASAWVWLLTAPMTLYYFNVVSPIACPLNVILWIPIFISLLAGILLLIVCPFLSAIPWIGSFLGILIGYPLGFLCGLGLFFTDLVVRWCEHIPLGHFWLPSPSNWMVVIYYVGLLAILCCFGFEKITRRWIASLTCIWLLISATPMLSKPWQPHRFFQEGQKEQAMLATFIDVGHGTCVLMELPDDQVWIYDAGRMGEASRSHLSISSVLWNRGLTRIDKLFLSHADSDHFCAIAGLAKRFMIGELCTTRQTLCSDSQLLQETLRKLRSYRIPLRVIEPGELVDSNNVRCQILHPDRAGVSGSDNANSLCLLVESYGKKLLLPGDLEGEGTRRLLESKRTKIDVLMAPHHGSLSTKPAALLAWCEPSIVTISGGIKAQNPKVLSEYSSDSRRVFITANDHAIRVAFTRDPQPTIETWQYPKWTLSN